MDSVGWSTCAVWSQVILDLVPGFWKDLQSAGGSIQELEACSLVHTQENLGLVDPSIPKELGQNKRFSHD